MSEPIIKKDKDLNKNSAVDKRPSKEGISLTGFKLPIYSTEGKQIGEVNLDKSVFDGEINKKVLYQAIVAYQAAMHCGCASTKTRGEVSGGGKKPWKQKGTGRARAGSTRSPLWKHGGVVFGPHPRQRGYSLSSRIKLVALKSSLNAKLKKDEILVIDGFKFNKGAKTKEAAHILSVLPNLSVDARLKERTLGVMELDAQTSRCLRNIKNLELINPRDITAYNVLRAKKLLIDKGALNEIVRRIKGNSKEKITKESKAKT